MIKCYLGGCMSYLYKNDEYNQATQWRVQLIKKLLELNSTLGYQQFDWFDPTLNFIDNVQVANNKTVLHQNKYYLDQCDILIVNLDHINQSMGTLYEVFYCQIKGKPVIAFGDARWVNNPHLAESITIKLGTLDDVVQYLESYYAQ